MINCPNPTCRAANPEGSKRCQVCQSALPHRYLWGVGDWAASLKSGDLFNRRYLLKSDRIFLDTQPGLVPESLPELPDFLMPYLHLSAYPLHTPRPYAVMPSSDKESGKNYVLMLESSALSESGAELGAASDYSAQSPSLLPELSASWADAPPLRQLSWLWQIACLWDAFDAEQVASTLLNGSFLRVDWFGITAAGAGFTSHWSCIAPANRSARFFGRGLKTAHANGLKPQLAASG